MMRIRDATPDDLPAVAALWRALEEELPEPSWVGVDIDHEVRERAELIRREVAVVAENEIGEVIGFALACRRGRRLGEITDLYIIPAARRHGLAGHLVGRVVARLLALGVDTVQLQVVAGNDRARALYARWGFEEQELRLVSPLDALARRLPRPR